MIYFIGLYVYLCLLVAFVGRRSRMGFRKSFGLSLLITPVLAAVFIFFFSPARLSMLPQNARERLMR